MKIKAFLKLVEIQTKVASVIPFFTALLYVLYTTKRINVVNMIIMFFAEKDHVCKLKTFDHFI